MTTVILNYFDKRIQNRRTGNMIEERGLFKYRLWNITIFYDNRTPGADYQWGYQIDNRARHFFESFEKMAEIANDWSERMKLPFKVQHYGIIQGS